VRGERECRRQRFLGDGCANAEKRKRKILMKKKKKKRSKGVSTLRREEWV
jgi:hypothetical protein